MAENHSRGGVWHGGKQENCPTCNPVKVEKPVEKTASEPEVVIRENRPKKKVGA